MRLQNTARSHTLDVVHLVPPPRPVVPALRSGVDKRDEVEIIVTLKLSASTEGLAGSHSGGHHYTLHLNATRSSPLFLHFSLSTLPVVSLPTAVDEAAATESRRAARPLLDLWLRRGAGVAQTAVLCC